MSLRAVLFPFDLFGHGGTAAGATLLAEVLEEAIADAEDEPEPIRPQAYTRLLAMDEFTFATPTEVAAWRKSGRKAIRDALKSGDFTLWLAGNHLGVLPVYDELGADDLVIQCDAHLDCYDLAGTIETLSPGNFLRSIEGQRPRTVVLGHRDLFLPEARTRLVIDRAVPAEDCHADFGQVLDELRPEIASANRVWLDLDVDALDPAFAPAVHSPQPFGLTPGQLLALTRLVSQSPNWAGVSVSEFDPGRDDRDRTLSLLGWWVEALLLSRVERL